MDLALDILPHAQGTEIGSVSSIQGMVRNHRTMTITLQVGMVLW